MCCAVNRLSGYQEAALSLGRDTDTSVLCLCFCSQTQLEIHPKQLLSRKHPVGHLPQPQLPTDCTESPAWASSLRVTLPLPLPCLSILPAGLFPCHQLSGRSGPMFIIPPVLSLVMTWFSKLYCTSLGSMCHSLYKHLTSRAVRTMT